MAATFPALALGTAGSAATAGAAAVAPTVGLFGSAGAFSFMQTAATIGSLASIGSVLSAGSADKKALDAQARFDQLRARQEAVKGQQQATAIKEQLAASISTAVARGAASGIDIGSGSPANAVAAAAQDAERAYSMARLNSDNSASAYMMNAQTTRYRGYNAVRSSRTQAVGLASDYASRQADRGFSF